MRRASFLQSPAESIGALKPPVNVSGKRTRVSGFSRRGRIAVVAFASGAHWTSNHFGAARARVYWSLQAQAERHWFEDYLLCLADVGLLPADDVERHLAALAAQRETSRRESDLREARELARQLGYQLVPLKRAAKTGAPKRTRRGKADAP